MMNRTIIRVAHPYYASDPDCVHKTQPLPNENCLKIGSLLTYTLALLRIFVKKRYRDIKLEIVPAKGFSSNKWVNDSSVTSLVARGEADISPAHMHITYPRFQLVRYTPISFISPLSAIYKKPEKVLVMINFKTLFPDNIAFVGFLLIVFLAQATILSKMFADKLALESARISETMAWLLLGLYLEMLSSHLTVLFTGPVSYAYPFVRDGDVVKSTRQSDRRFAYRSNVIPETYNVSGIVLPKDASYAETFAKLAEQIPGIVWLTFSIEEVVEFKAAHCDFDVFPDFSTPPLSLGHFMQYNADFQAKLKRLTSAESGVAKEIGNRLRSLATFPRLNCRNKDAKSESLRVEQLSFPLLSLLFWHFTAALCLAAEHLFYTGTLWMSFS